SARYSSTDEGKRQVADLQRCMVPYRAAVDGFLAAVRSGDMELAVTSLERDVRPAREPLVKLLADTGSRQKQVLNDRLTVMESDLHTLQLQLLGMLVAVAVVSVLASGWLMARLRSRVNEATVVAERIANSDLAKPVAVTGDDEFTGLLRQMASMRDALHKVVLTVRQSSEGIGLASSEVAAGNQDLSSRTESTASNLEQTASSMEQITATVQQSADAARQANQLASTATAVAVRGGEVVGQVVSTMQDINQSSQKIADIIGVIDSIAFQTNILALNAAVEAARAGEQGRLIAVVACEVRSLAQRSAGAAKEIKELIGASVEKVRSGSELVRSAGETMGEIVSSVQRVTDIIGEISAAAGEQSNGIAQINVAVTQLDQMTQQNAALVEESAAAAQSLRDQALRLTEVVSVFQLGEYSASAASSLSQPRAAKPAGPGASPAPRALSQPMPHPKGGQARLGSS
ncbi:MAG: methyl-accepting chemotaxis protein, partial [Burkholderiaceae bacterium]|nr:methyl-accepting chemotaxis protein [Burkholderiaceae bacterium]